MAAYKADSLSQVAVQNATLLACELFTTGQKELNPSLELQQPMDSHARQAEGFPEEDGSACEVEVATAELLVVD
jgi:hypothetical protein